MYTVFSYYNGAHRKLHKGYRRQRQICIRDRLKGADEPLRDKLFSCMSSRAAANLQDEMEALGPVRLTEVQEAQKRIINVARRMSDEGSIVLGGRGGDDVV